MDNIDDYYASCIDTHIKKTFEKVALQIINCGFDRVMDTYIGYYIIVVNYGVVYRATPCLNIHSDTINCEIETARF